MPLIAFGVITAAHKLGLVLHSLRLTVSQELYRNGALIDRRGDIQWLI